MNFLKRFCLVTALMIMNGVYAFGQTPGVKIVSVHPDLKIKITRCEAVGKTVVIDMVLENAGSNDVNFNMAGGDNNESIAYDDEGNMYSYNNIKVKLGNSELRSSHLGGMVLPAGIPIKGRIQIEGVPESASMFRRIDLRMFSDTWGFFGGKNAKITNVPISREGDE